MPITILGNGALRVKLRLEVVREAAFYSSGLRRRVSATSRGVTSGLGAS
jgi:hypothetical protein